VVNRVIMYDFIGRKLVGKSIEAMKGAGAQEIILEAEITNPAALRLYECMKITL
jgi:ribosomal protein S18 acetylase RimI-like enzyme